MWTNKHSRLLTASITLVAALATSAVSFTAGAQDEDRLQKIREKGEISVAVYRDFPPYSYAGEGGRYTGVDVDIANALAQQLGVRLILNPVTAGEDSNDDLRTNIWRGPLINGSASDLMLHLGMDPEYVKRNDKADLFNAYQRETVAVIYHSDVIEKLDSPLSLSGHKVAVENDSISDYYLSGGFNGRLASAAVRKTTVEEAVDAYFSNEVDAVMAPRGQLEGALFKRKQSAAELDISEFVGLFRSSWDVGMAIKAGNPQLRAALEKAMATLQQSGELDTIYARYGVKRAEPKVAATASTG